MCEFHCSMTISTWFLAGSIRKVSETRDNHVIDMLPTQNSPWTQDMQFNGCWAKILFEKSIRSPVPAIRRHNFFTSFRLSDMSISVKMVGSMVYSCVRRNSQTRSTFTFCSTQLGEKSKRRKRLMSLIVSASALHLIAIRALHSPT